MIVPATVGVVTAGADAAAVVDAEPAGAGATLVEAATPLALDWLEAAAATLEEPAGAAGA